MEKVYCKNCKHFYRFFGECTFTEKRYFFNTVTGLTDSEIIAFHIGDQDKLNKKNNCKFYKKNSLLERIFG